MIREWLLIDGNKKRYDTVTKYVQTLTMENVPVDSAHPADEDEFAEYLEHFPEATQEETAAKTVMIASLMQVLNQLRGVTADSQIDPVEFASANPAVQAVLRQYSAFQYNDATVDKLAFLLLTQVSYAYSLLLTRASQVSQQMSLAIIDLTFRLEALENAQNEVP